jgi:hypothetical protein
LFPGPGRPGRPAWTRRARAGAAAAAGALLVVVPLTAPPALFARQALTMPQVTRIEAPPAAVASHGTASHRAASHGAASHGAGDRRVAHLAQQGGFPAIPVLAGLGALLFAPLALAGAAMMFRRRPAGGSPPGP